MRAELASMIRLRELSTRLTATTDLPSILYEMLDATIELRGADFGDVQLYDEATGTPKSLHIEASTRTSRITSKPSMQDGAALNRGQPFG
jgi:GAF domain-containing protein